MEALLAAILAGLVRQQIRVGLGRGYTTRTNRLRGIRGRVDFHRSLLGLTFEQGQAVCRYDEFLANVPKNQILRSTMERLIQRGSFGPDRNRADALRHELRTRVRSLEDVDSIELRLDTFRRVLAVRRGGNYDLMIAICELLHRCWMPTEAGGHSAAPTLNRAEVVLHEVYERFVANFFRVHLSGWSITAQARLSWYEEISSPRLPGMVPDLVLESPDKTRRLVLDTKFSSTTLVRGRFDRETFKSGHLYQMYAYLRTQEARSPTHANAAGMLLYPAVGISVRDVIRVQGHDVHFATIDLDQEWVSIERELLELIQAPNCSERAAPAEQLG